MQDHHQTAKQALKENLINYFKPTSFRVNHRLRDINDLRNLDYDLFILDRDCTLQGYHEKKRVSEFEETLKQIGSKSELVSNSSFNEFLKIRDIFGDVMPISKLIKFNGIDYLIRFDNNKISILRYVRDLNGVTFKDETNKFMCGDKLLHPISYNYKKPNPLTVESAVHINIHNGRIPINSKALMVGDRYLTDIVAGNLAQPVFAKVDTARVIPYKPLTDKLDLILIRYLLDSPFGTIMSRI